MAVWITDRTSSDIERVLQLFEKAKSKTLTPDEQSEWNAGMKGALSWKDYNRIESGIAEIAKIIGAKVSVKTNWDENGYLTATDAARWIYNVKSIRALLSGTAYTPHTPDSIVSLSFSLMNQIETILFDVESLAKDYLVYCSEPICGGEPLYGF